MRYPLGALFLASCTMLAPLPAGHRAIEEPSYVTHPEPENWTGARKPKPRTSSSPSPSSEILSCANLDTGDMKETIKAKLDCITENAR